MEISLPEQDEIANVINKINSLALEVTALEYELEVKEAEIVREATLNEKYFIKEKSQPQEFIKNSWKITGFNGELVELRKLYNFKNTELENAKRSLKLIEMLIDIWRTSSANERGI